MRLLLDLWFREVFGYALWAWLIVLLMVAVIACGIVLGTTNRCSPQGDCWPEY